jgi:hypothetical protein
MSYDSDYEQRLDDLIYWVHQVYPGQSITPTWTFRKASLGAIAKSRPATQRIIDWCNNQLKQKRAKQDRASKAWHNGEGAFLNE